MYDCEHIKDPIELYSSITLINIQKKPIQQLLGIINSVQNVQQQLPVYLVAKIKPFTYLVEVMNNDILNRGDIVLYKTENDYYKLSKISDNFDKEKQYFTFTNIINNNNNYKYVSFINYSEKLSTENENDIILVCIYSLSLAINKNKNLSDAMKNLNFPYQDDLGNYSLVITQSHQNRYSIGKYYKSKNVDDIGKGDIGERIKINENQMKGLSVMNSYYTFIRGKDFDPNKYSIVNNLM